jgi:hypothetical protein
MALAQGEVNRRELPVIPGREQSQRTRNPEIRTK